MMGIGVFGPIIGKLYHRFGARVVTFAGSLICVIASIATAKASNLYIMFVTYGILFGFGSCGIFLVTYIAVPRYFIKWRSLSLGLIAMGPGGGLFVMSPLVQVLYEKFGWRGTFLAMGGIIAVTCILALVYQPIMELEKEGLNENIIEDKKFWDVSIFKHNKFLICTTSATIIYLGHYTPPVHMVRWRYHRYIVVFWHHPGHAINLHRAHSICSCSFFSYYNFLVYCLRCKTNLAFG